MDCPVCRERNPKLETAAAARWLSDHLSDQHCDPNPDDAYVSGDVLSNVGVDLSEVGTDLSAQGRIDVDADIEARGQ
jgi:hypothetical protein